MIGNIEGVVQHFNADGLAHESYLKTVVRQPSLFCQKPETVVGNIEGVVQHFTADGLARGLPPRGGQAAAALHAEAQDRDRQHRGGRAALRRRRPDSRGLPPARRPSDLNSSPRSPRR